MRACLAVPGKSPSPEPVRLSWLPKGLWSRRSRMRRMFRLSLSIIALVSFLSSNALAAGPGKSLATITGTVRDNHGNPLAGALVTLVREGAKVVKHTPTDRAGNFIAKVIPGRYGIKANANRFAEVCFNA